MFDVDDLREFVDELQTLLLVALADNDTSEIDQMIRDWRITARQLEDPLRRSVLTARHDSSSFMAAAEPSET